MRIPFSQIDAFATASFSGNPAAVMPLAEWLPDAQLQSIAEENNLAETAFLRPHDNPAIAEFELRWFTPAVEVALCGHATLASGHLILDALPELPMVRFLTRQSGVLSVARGTDGQYEMALPALPAHTEAAKAMAAQLAAALGAEPAEVWLRGDQYCLAVFEHAHEVRALKPDMKSLTQLLDPAAMFIATSLGLGDGSGAQVISRVFVPGAGIDEDSVTGSAHCVLAPYWSARMGRESFSAYQASKRGGHIGCRMAGTQVVLTGRCRTVIEGEFILASA